MLLEPLDAKELRAQDLAAVPGRERRAAPENATQRTGPVSLKLPGRNQWDQGCDLAVRADRTRGHRWSAIRFGNTRDQGAQAFPRTDHYRQLLVCTRTTREWEEPVFRQGDDCTSQAPPYWLKRPYARRKNNRRTDLSSDAVRVRLRPGGHAPGPH